MSPHDVYRCRVLLDVLTILSIFFVVTGVVAGIIYFSVFNGDLNSTTGADGDTWNFNKVFYEDVGWSFVYALAGEFLLLGIFACAHGMCTGDCNCDGPRVGRPDIWCFNCGDINCSDCRSNNDECGAICALIMIIVAVILILVGIIYAVFVSITLISRMSAKHYAKLQAKLMARKYVVKDLDGYDRAEILKLNREPAENAPLLGSSENVNHVDSCSTF